MLSIWTDVPHLFQALNSFLYPLGLFILYLACLQTSIKWQILNEKEPLIMPTPWAILVYTSPCSSKRKPLINLRNWYLNPEISKFCLIILCNNARLSTIRTILQITHGKTYFYIIIIPSFILAFVVNMKTTFGTNVIIFLLNVGREKNPYFSCTKTIN